MLKIAPKTPQITPFVKTDKSTPKTENKSKWTVFCASEVQTTEKQKLVCSANKNEENGDVIIDIRTYVNSNKYTGPTSKGVVIPLGKAEEFVETLGKLYKNMLNLGLFNKD